VGETLSWRKRGKLKVEAALPRISNQKHPKGDKSIGKWNLRQRGLTEKNRKSNNSGNQANKNGQGPWANENGEKEKIEKKSESPIIMETKFTNTKPALQSAHL